MTLFFKVAVLAALIISTSGYALSTVSGTKFYAALIPGCLGLLFVCSKKSRLYSLRRLEVHNISYFLFLLFTVVSFVVNLEVQNFAYVIKFILTLTFA